MVMVVMMLKIPVDLRQGCHHRGHHHHMTPTCEQETTTLCWLRSSRHAGCFERNQPDNEPPQPRPGPAAAKCRPDQVECHPAGL
ncbi:hypothetical protein HaLaN_08299 [Haematococcus lacustris]|uniref:Uncharacterized protein n=1 Tax=Haematococcus lacustris TaxID=44745 RepID=A0A699Z011_HAELA|nr:hypothetical protein HaLaN_08299 [Haematococcus lacustris]